MTKSHVLTSSASISSTIRLWLWQQFKQVTHCSRLLLKCRVATNLSHWLRVQSRWFKNYIFAKVYFDKLLDFPILLLLFLHALLLCHILLFGCWFFQHHPGVKQFGSRPGPTNHRAWSGSKLFAMVISRQQKSPLVGKELNTKQLDTTFS